MKLRIFTLTIFSLLCTLSWGQLLYNSGGTITITTGATLYVEGGVENTATGTIDNNGTMEIKGNFVNAGTWESSDPNTVKFSGNINSDVTSGGALFHTVINQKDDTYNVNLMDNMTITNNLDFNSTGATNMLLGANHLVMGSLATVTGYDSDEFVVTASTGTMKKAFGSAGSFTYPVGFNSTTYNQATINMTAGPADTIRVRVLGSPTDGDGLTGTPITSEVVDAVWDIKESTVGGTTADVTLGWQESDELTGFDDALNAVSRNDGVNGWDGLFDDLGPEVSNTQTKTGYTEFGAFTVGGESVSNSLLVNAKVLLQGPWVTGNSLMHDSLRVWDYIPLTEPYSSAPYNFVHKSYGGGETVSSNSVFNQASDGDDVVDWVVVELRSNPYTAVATKSGLLQRDGNIVDLDGTSNLAIRGVADGSYYLGIRHRNHLPVRSDASVSLSNTPSALVDFTNIATAYDSSSIVKPTTPLKLLAGTTYGLWSGDSNFNRTISYNGASNDKNIILATVGITTPNNSVAGYNRADTNMNRVTTYNGASNDKNVILINVGITTPNDILRAHINN